MKKRWKKLTALCMAAITAASLAGCGGADSAGGGESTSADTTAKSGEIKEVK